MRNAGIQLVCRPDALRRGLFAARAGAARALLHRAARAHLRRPARASCAPPCCTSTWRSTSGRSRGCTTTVRYRADVLERPPVEALQADLNALLRTWDDELRDALARHRLATRRRTAGGALRARAAGGVQGRHRGRRRRARRPLPRGAVRHRRTRRSSSSQPAAAGAPHALKLYLANEALVLSDFVPVLENLGLRVLGQDVVDLELPEVESACIHTFAVAPTDAAARPRSAPRRCSSPRCTRCARGAVESDRAQRAGRRRRPRLARRRPAARLRRARPPDRRRLAARR